MEDEERERRGRGIYMKEVDNGHTYKPLSLQMCMIRRSGQVTPDQLVQCTCTSGLDTNDLCYWP